MRIHSKDKPSAISKAVAWTVISLLAACGSGSGNPPNSMNTLGGDARLAATTTAVSVVTPASYTVANLGAKFELGNEDNRALNDRGQVVGSIAEGEWNTAHAFRYENGTLTDLGTLGDPNNSSTASAINAAGLVTGDLRIGNTYRAFRSDGTNMINLGTVQYPGNNSFSSDINDSGLVAGNLIDGKFSHAFLYNGTTMTDLGGLGNAANPSNAVAINASGLVTGNSFNGRTTHAFLFDGTKMNDLGALISNDHYSFAFAINASGQAVGRSQVDSIVEHAFIKSPGDSQMIDLNTRLINAPGVVLLRAVAISDSGYILAQADTGWVLLKPSAAVPAPAAATLGAITANDPVAAGTPVNVSVQFADINTTDTHTAFWTWEGNGSTAGTLTEPNGTVPGTVTGSTTFSAAGLYNVIVSVTDSSGLTSTVGRQVVVYDPSAGFVTGGGWIMSPAGAYKADERLSGRATFGFVSKYLKGANKPSGETEFRFQAGGGLNFYSNNYDWLVVGGARAQYKGTGTINGRGNYQFMLTAVDGDLIAKGTADRFRIKIWHHDDSTNTDVTDYDNQLDSNVAGSNQEGTLLGGGSINVKIR